MAIEDKQADLYDKFFNVKDKLSDDQVRKLEDSFDFFGEIYEEADIEDLDKLLDQIEEMLCLYVIQQAVLSQ